MDHTLMYHATKIGRGETMDELLKEEEVAEIIKLGLSTLRNMRHNQKGLPYVKLGRSVRYKRSDVEQYINEHTIAVSG